MRRSHLLALALAACADAPSDGVDTDTEVVDTEVADTDVVDTEVDAPVDSDTDVVIDADADGSPAGEDCDDDDPTRRPGIADRCDGVDNDCDTDVDEDPLTSFRDGDGDGFGDSATSQAVCDPGSPWVFVDGDCDDADPLVHPGAAELCNERDDDCSRLTSEDGTATWFPQTGPAVDMTAALTGTSTSPARLTLTDPGALQICFGTWFVELTVDGRPTIQGFGHPVLSGANTWRPITVVGGPPFLRALVLADGLGQALTAGGPTVGGNLYVDHMFMLARDLELRDGRADIGGGAYIDGGVFDVSDLDVHDNEAVSWGGGMAFADAGLTMNGGRFERNSAPSGAAIHGSDGASLFMSNGLITNHTSLSAVHLQGDADLTCWGQRLNQFGIVRTTGAAIALGPQGALNLRDCDFGEGAQANDDDLLYLDAGDALPDLGDDATAICTGNSCD